MAKVGDVYPFLRKEYKRTCVWAMHRISVWKTEYTGPLKEEDRYMIVRDDNHDFKDVIYVTLIDGVLHGMSGDCVSKVSIDNYNHTGMDDLMKCQNVIAGQVNAFWC